MNYIPKFPRRKSTKATKKGQGSLRVVGEVPAEEVAKWFNESALVGSANMFTMHSIRRPMHRAMTDEERDNYNHHGTIFGTSK